MSNKWKTAIFASVLAALVGGAANGQDFPDPERGYPDQDYPDLSTDDDSIRQTVARLSYISGDVSFARGDDPDDWQQAYPNIPMTLGDRVWTANGRLELQIHGGNLVRIARRTVLTALNLTDDTKQFSLSAGVASFGIRQLYEDELFEVDTPNAAITFITPGDYRIDVRPDGDTRLQVRRGRAIVASGGGQVPLSSGQAILIDGFEPPRYDYVPMGYPDGWDGWVQGREARYARVKSYQYVSPSIAGVEDLDDYGSWQRLPQYGWCWTPSSVSIGWAPYRAGRWIWQDPWGWTWVSTERWGWAPYHYGRWVTVSRRWYWLPVAPSVAVVAYRPALVAFVGGGPEFGVSAGFGAVDYIGWFPLGPREPFIPWWGRPAVNVNVNVTNITYVNRTYVTVVNQTTFVQSRAVATNTVRDASIVQRIERAPVVRGTIPVVPTRDSIRVSAQPTRAARPPEQMASRAVVARVAPPPAPPRFDEKVQVIRQNRGAPVDREESQRIVAQRSQMRATAPVRSATAESGRVELSPRTEKAQTVQPEPVSSSRGRTLATREQPVAPMTPGPATDARERQRAPARVTVAPEPEAPISRQARPVRAATPSRQAPPARQAPETREAPPARQTPQTREVPQSREAPSASATRVRENPPPQGQPQERSEKSQRPTPRPPAQAQPPQDARERGEPATVDRTQPPAGSRERGEQAKPTPSSKDRDRSHPRPTPTPRD
jgi:Family of unknown function (DUF6600)/FecR protein